MASVAERQTIIEFPALFRMFLEGQDVMSVKLDTLHPAALARSKIPRDDSASPCPMLAAPIFPAAVRVKQPMLFTRPVFLTVSRAFL